MTEQKKYKDFSASDIEKYHRGLLSPQEMHDLEKAALDDPLLADALEGYGSSGVNVAADLSELQNKLSERVGGKIKGMGHPPHSYRWWKAAAAIVILGGIAFLTYRLSTNHSSDELAKVDQKKPDVKTTTIQDSNGLSPKGSAVTSDSNRLSEKKVLEEKERLGPSVEKNSVTDTLINSLSMSSHSGENEEARKPATNFQKMEDSSRGLGEQTVFKRSIENEKTSVPQPMARAERDAYRKDEQVITTEASGSKEKKLNKFSVKGNAEMSITNYFRGRVLDANNNPLPFANITNISDNVGTYADAKGYFVLTSPDSVMDVRIRSVGFQDKTSELKYTLAINQVTLQDDKTTPDKILSFRKPDTTVSRMANIKIEEPEPADGWINYGTYIVNNIQIPEGLNLDKLSARVQVSFDVDKNGDPVNIKAQKSSCQKCEEEAVRLISEGPKWKKKNKGLKRVTVTIPFDNNR